MTSTASLCTSTRLLERWIFQYCVYSRFHEMYCHSFCAAKSSCQHWISCFKKTHHHDHECMDKGPCFTRFLLCLWQTIFTRFFTNFPFLSSNIPSSPAYGVFISQLIRYARACSSYECFILRARRLPSKLLKQGYLVERLKSSFRKFYGRYGDLVEQYWVTLSRMLNDILTLDQQWPPYQSDFPPISWPLYRAWPSPNYDWFPWSICNGCG